MERGKPSTYIVLPTATGLCLLDVTRSDLFNVFNTKDHLTAYICESFRSEYDRSYIPGVESICVETNRTVLTVSPHAKTP